MQRLAEEVLAGEHGPIGFTVNLAEGQSWSKILSGRGLAETARKRLTRAAQGIAAEALEKREMDMGAQTATIECDEIARVQVLKPGGCYMLTCSAPPGLHSELLLRLPFLYLTVSILSLSVVSVVSVGFCCDNLQ